MKIKSSSKKTGAEKAKKAMKSVLPVKKAKKIAEYYLLLQKKTDVKEIQTVIHAVDEEKVDIWPALNLMEVVLENDSLILQDGSEVFVDPLDLAFLNEKGIQTVYVISFDEADKKTAFAVLKEILEAMGGMIGSDTDDFEPSYTVDNL